MANSVRKERGKYKRGVGVNEFTNLRVTWETREILRHLSAVTGKQMGELMYEMAVAYLFGHGLEKEMATVITFRRQSDEIEGMISTWRGEYIDIIAERVKEMMDES